MTTPTKSTWLDEIFAKAGPPKPKAKRTPAQNQALKAYNFALAQEDRYLGSVFVSPKGQAEIEAKTKAAHDVCVALGMGPEHGL